MRGATHALLLLAAIAAAQEQPLEFQVRPLGFSVAVPAGWTGEQGATGLVARDSSDNGFIVTREPFLHDFDTFATAWQTQLTAAKLDARVDRVKVAGRDAWRAAWTVGERQIEVWRLHAPECEMLYNISFSGGPGFDLKSIVEPTLKSFKCTAPKAELRFQQNAESVTNRIGLRLPEGFAKEQGLEGFQLGGGISGGFVCKLPGYDPPHVAGRIRLQQRDAGVTYGTMEGDIAGGDTDKWLERAWRDDQEEFAPVTKKPRPKHATLGGVKGSVMEVAVVSKGGLPQRWMGFVGKHKQDTFDIIVVIDERDARLHKDYLKQLCSNLVIAK